MGQYAEDIIEGICDSSGDYTYKDNYVYKGKYKDEPWEANIRKVRKELAILIKQKLEEFKQDNNNKIVDTCRKYINLKYGKGWIILIGILKAYVIKSLFGLLTLK